MKENRTENIFQAIEQLWGYQLPKEYRNFLLSEKRNIFSNKIFNFVDNKDGSCINEFFGIIKDLNNNLLLKQKYSGTRVPENCLPIANDVYGNLILLSVKGPDRGKVYFWDHEMEAEEGEIPDYSNLTFIADSFDEFLSNLKEPNEA